MNLRMIHKGQQYNSTYQYFTYDIPLSPTTNYSTIIFNSTWTLTNAYPSTVSSGENVTVEAEVVNEFVDDS